MSLLAAIAAVPKILSQLERLAAAAEGINELLVLREAAERRKEKDEEVNAIIDSIIRNRVRSDEDDEQRSDLNGEA